MRVSIAMCTYNGSRFLAQQLRSLAAQTRLPDELVICDDASNDETNAIIHQFAASAPFATHLIRNATNLQSTQNFEQAIRLCGGDIIFLCDQDDEWHPDKLAMMSAEFQNAAVGLVASDLELMDVAGHRLGRTMWSDLGFTPTKQALVASGGGPQMWLQQNTLTGAAMAFRASLREVILPIPPTWVHDAWIALILGSIVQVRVLPQTLTRYRIHLNQQIGSQPRTFRRQLDAARRMDCEYFAKILSCFEAAHHRLGSLEGRVQDAELVSLVARKVAFTRMRQRMRTGRRIERIRLAIRGLLAGDYRRFAHGWKGFAADLVL